MAQIPPIFYGTAWKEDLTEPCVREALRAGFRAVDTANQRKHYYEEGTGHALEKVYSELGLKREDVFIQTKFTFARGQDHRKPYDDQAPPKIQVKQSFESSLAHLKTDFIDSYVLHGPSMESGLTEVDWETWTAMEEICQAGHIRHLGVSNVNFAQLSEFHNKAKIKPKFVQNRCFAERKWDGQIREFCRQNKILYQGFSLLTANSKFLGGEVQRPAGRNVPQLTFQSQGGVHPRIQEILRDTGKTMQQIVFRFARQVGIIPIVGTRTADHMRLDLSIDDFSLTHEQIDLIENIAFL